MKQHLFSVAFGDVWAEHAKWHKINPPTFMVSRASTTTGPSLLVAVEPFDFFNTNIRLRQTPFRPCFLPCHSPFQMSNFLPHLKLGPLSIPALKPSRAAVEAISYEKRGDLLMLHTPLPTLHIFIVVSREFLRS